MDYTILISTLLQNIKIISDKKSYGRGSDSTASAAGDIIEGVTGREMAFFNHIDKVGLAVSLAVADKPMALRLKKNILDDMDGYEFESYLAALCKIVTDIL